MENKYLIVIGGPTAIGKSQLGIDLAKILSCEIISADSRQFYREMSIGTAKPTHAEMQEIPHHFINNLSINDTFNVGKFEEEALKKIEQLHQKNNVVLVVGGSGLYIDSLLYGMDDLPENNSEIREMLKKETNEKGLIWLQNKLKQVDFEYYKTAELNNKNRIMRAVEVSLISKVPYSTLLQKSKANRSFKTLFIVLNTQRELLYEKINKRVDVMMQMGLLDEVKALYAFKENNALNTVGYKELFAYLDGLISLEQAVSLIKQNTRRYAKRQITWFKRNKEAKWFDPNEQKTIVKECLSFIQKNS